MLGSQLTSMSGVSSRNLLLTDTRASSGHSWNQSMAVQLTTAGNLLARTRRVEPTGEKQRTTWGRAAVAEWGVPAVRAGLHSRSSAADLRSAAFPLTPSVHEVVVVHSVPLTRAGTGVPLVAAVSIEHSAGVGVPRSAQHGVWPWKY